jgi:hypothetical protein
MELMKISFFLIILILMGFASTALENGMEEERSNETYEYEALKSLLT